MQHVLSHGLWTRVRRIARKARHRQAAIAYVTRDLIGFRKGDVLVTNASTQAISSGETSASLLSALHRKRVKVHHCPDLHAKVLLLDGIAVIGSGNMSNSSADGLIEAGVLTDHGSTVAGVASFIEQLARQSNELDAKDLAMLCKIKVVRRGGWGRNGKRPRRTKIARLGNRTWMVGVRELVRDPVPEEQRLIAHAEKLLRAQQQSRDEEADWIRWTGKSRFVCECREGDSVIQIFRSSMAKRPSAVFYAAPVRLKQRAKRWTRFYLGEPLTRKAQASWGRFQKLLKELGYARRVGPCIEHLLEPDLADAIARRWNSAAKD